MAETLLSLCIISVDVDTITAISLSFSLLHTQTHTHSQNGGHIYQRQIASITARPRMLLCSSQILPTSNNSYNFNYSSYFSCLIKLFSSTKNSHTDLQPKSCCVRAFKSIKSPKYIRTAKVQRKEVEGVKQVDAAERRLGRCQQLRKWHH